MRHFKYESLPDTDKMTARERKNYMTKEEKRLNVIDRIVTVIVIITFFAVWAGVFAASWWLMYRIPVFNGVTFVLDVLAYILLFAVGILGGFVLGAVVASLMGTVNNALRKRIKASVNSRYKEALHAFYGFCEPYVVTKCYECTEKCFNDHDVCIFFSDGELRITADITRDVIGRDKDLGCIAIDIGEVTCSLAERESYTATELRCNDTEIVLGERAYEFIEQNIKN